MKRLISLIDKYSIIFFDIFDTLIKRNIGTELDVFLLVERLYNKRYNTNINFYKDRLWAEKEARKETVREDVTLNDIYKFLAQKYKKKTCEILKTIEIQTEIDLSISNNNIYKVYEYCLLKKKEIYIVSDMYLPKSVIENILYKNRINGYIKLYVSSEVGLTKWHDGHLFKKVIIENDLDKKDILHIGNNKRTDYKMAKKQGINAFLIKEENSYGKYLFNYFIKEENLLDYKILDHFIANTLNNKDTNFSTGYEVYGPMLYEYSNWLLRTAKRLNLKRIYFFSRDGYILKKAFDMLNSDIETYYFYTSRRCIIVPTLASLDNYEDMISMYKSFPKKCSIAYLFNKLGLNVCDFKEILDKKGLFKETIVSIDNIDKNVDSLLIEILPYIKENSIVQRNLFIKYMEQFKFQGNVGIVDMGASCSIELALKKLISLLNLDINLVPMYIHSAKKIDNKNRYALYNTNKNSANRNLLSIYPFGYAWLEIFFSAPHGSVIKYAEEQNEVVPVLDKYMYEKDIMAHAVDTLRKGALSFITDMEKSNVKKYIDWNPDISIVNLRSFVITPSYQNSSFWGKYKYDRDTGYASLATPKNILKYIFNPLRLKRDFVNSDWKAGFIVNLFHSKYAAMTLYKIYLYFKSNHKKYHKG